MPKKGYKPTEEHKRNLSLSHIGYKPSEETIQKRSLAMKGEKHFNYKKHLSIEWKRNLSLSHKGKPTWIKGKHHKSETLQKIREKHKGKHHSPATEFKKGYKPTKEHKRNLGLHNARYWLGKKRSEETKVKIKERRAKQIVPFKDSKPELKIQKYLNELNIDFIKHQNMKIEHGYQCDILIPSLNMILEADGDYWHGNPLKYPSPTEWQIKKFNTDKARTQELIEKGFKVLRLWESEIKAISLEKFQERINEVKI